MALNRIDNEASEHNCYNGLNASFYGFELNHN